MERRRNMTKHLFYFSCFLILFPDNCLGIMWKYPYKNRLKEENNVWLQFGGYLTRLLCQSTFERKVKNSVKTKILL